MTQHRAQALKDKLVYVDRTVYCRREQHEERKQLKAKIIALGGQLVSEVNEADFIFVHLATTTHDRTLASVRDKILMAEYAVHCYDENAILPTHRYRVDIDASPEPPAPTHLRRRAIEHTPPSPPPARSQHHTRARTRGADLLPVSQPLDPMPVPGFRLPATSPFSHALAREWACAFVRWHAMYTPDGTEAVCLRAASACMAKIAPQLLPSTFRNVYVKDPPFLDRLRQIVRKSREDAERKKIAGLDESSLDGLLEDAGKAYAAESERLLALSTSASLVVAPSSPPRAPQSIFKVDERRKKRVTAEGGAYLQQLLRYLLLRGPLRSWDAIDKGMPKASNGLVSTSMFRKYRLAEGNAALTKIREEFEGDRDAFRIKHGGLDEAPSAGQQTPRKRRRSVTQEANRSTRLRGSDGQYIQMGPNAYASTAKFVGSSSEDEDWNYVG